MLKKFFSLFLICLLVCTIVSERGPAGLAVTAAEDSSTGRDLIKWVDFDVSYEALKDAMNLDIETWDQDLHISWVDSPRLPGSQIRRQL